MKKLLPIILLSSALLISCGSNSNGGTTPAKEPEVVTLSLDNYEKYITGYIYESSSSTTFRTYWNFYGSCLCKFENAIIYYTKSNSSSTTLQCKLSISGNGQFERSYSASGSSSSQSFTTTITNVTGQVTILF